MGVEQHDARREGALEVLERVAQVDHKGSFYRRRIDPRAVVAFDPGDSTTAALEKRPENSCCCIVCCLCTALFLLLPAAYSHASRCVVFSCPMHQACMNFQHASRSRSSEYCITSFILKTIQIFIRFSMSIDKNLSSLLSNT